MFQRVYSYYWQLSEVNTIIYCSNAEIFDTVKGCTFQLLMVVKGAMGFKKLNKIQQKHESSNLFKSLSDQHLGHCYYQT